MIEPLLIFVLQQRLFQNSDTHLDQVPIRSRIAAYIGLRDRREAIHQPYRRLAIDVLKGDVGVVIAVEVPWVGDTEG